MNQPRMLARETPPQHTSLLGARNQYSCGRATDHIGRGKKLSTDLAWKESRPEFSPLIAKSPGDRNACFGGRFTAASTPAYRDETAFVNGICLVTLGNSCIRKALMAG